MNTRFIIGACAIVASLTLASCDSRESEGTTGEHAAAEEMERGPHRGRMLRDGAFAVEVTIFEEGVEPEFRLYGYRDGKPLASNQFQAVIDLTRLGGKMDRFTFQPQEDFLRGAGVVREPHSFDVKVTASDTAGQHTWSYQSYEGRTTISADAAKRVLGRPCVADNRDGALRVVDDAHAAARAARRRPWSSRSVPLLLRRTA